MLVEYDNPNKLVVQHKRFINARFDMNMNQLRIFIYMLLQIKKDDTNFRRIRIPCQMLHGSQSKVHYEEIRQAADELSKKAIEIVSITPKGRKKWEKINLMSYCSYTEREGHILASFNSEAAPYLLNLSENFKGVEYERWSNIKSYYSYRFFWLLAQFEDSGYFEVSLKDLKEMFYIEDKYSRYYDFKRKVIIPVQKDLEQNSFPFTFKEVKDATRNVVKLRFYFGKLATPLREAALKASKTSKTKAQYQTEISFQTKESNGSNATAELETWMVQLGFSLLDIERYKAGLDPKVLKRSVYGLHTNWIGSNLSLAEIHNISKECLDKLLEQSPKTVEENK